MQTLIAALCFTTLLVVPAQAATKTTVSQLNKIMSDLYEQHKPDEAVAIALKEIDLTEQLTTPAMNSLMQYKPGPYTVRQILLLSADSSLLPPPSADIPTFPAPDQDTQTALIRKAADYADRDFSHLPSLSSEKQTLRFQNGVAFVKNTSGNGSRFGDVHAPGDIPEQLFLSLIGQQTLTVVVEGGVEQQPAIVKQKEPAGQLGQISQGIPGLSLPVVLTDATKGSIQWLRWQMINGRQTAVFSFSIPRTASHYKINYCCFPVLDHVGSGMEFTASSGSVSTFNPFTSAPGYRGEIFIDLSGIVVRLITKADMKPTDFVQQEDIRVDYAPVLVGGKRYIVPVKSTILTTVVPNGDSYVKFSTRRTVFDITYRKYESAPPASH